MSSKVILADLSMTMKDFLAALKNGSNMKVPYKERNSTAKYSFLLITQHGETIHLAEAYLSKDTSDLENGWSCNLYQVPRFVFLFFLEHEQDIAWKNVLELEFLFLTLVQDYGFSDKFNYKFTNSAQDVTEFVGGDWWVPDWEV